ncbi:MAG: hypothetical protein ACQETB_11215 [Halobacteriota archaeon]
MGTSVKLSRVESLLETLEYPIDREGAVSEFEDVTLLMADGETNLGDLVSAVESDRFRDTDDLSSALHNVLPIEALGEPGQSDGDA